MTKTFFGAAAAALVFAAAVACSSSSSGNGGSGTPTCKNPTSSGAGSATCSSCLQSNCSSQLSGVEANCQAYVACYEGCDCSDLNCLIGCQQKIDATCQSAAQAEGMCTQTSCSSQCSASSGDAGGGG